MIKVDKKCDIKRRNNEREREREKEREGDIERNEKKTKK